MWGHIWCLIPHFLCVFSLSRPVNPKHNPCTCRMMLRCCPAMAREQILTESINPSTMELWNSLPDNLRHLDLSHGQFRSVLTESAAPSDLYFSALTINLLTSYFTKEATQIIHHFVQNCSRCIENYCFKHKKLVGCRRGGGLCPLAPTGAPPQTPII